MASKDDSSKTNKKRILYLLLGEADFTFSLDMIHYFHEQQQQLQLDSSSCNDDDGDGGGIVERFLVTTGFDTLDEVHKKYYPHSESILKKIRGLNGKGDVFRGLQVVHGVDALQIADEIFQNVIDFISTTCDSNSKSKHHFHEFHVIFNHPHLGTEDALLHSRFLCHLFFSIKTLLNRPFLSIDKLLFHLTLAQGQFKRWETVDGASRHGFHLLNQQTFYSPTTGKKDLQYYEYRRHQSGKSFNARVKGSETITFLYSKDSELLDLNKIKQNLILPWFQKPNCYVEDNNYITSDYGCKFCEKVFFEERGLKCHMTAVHTNNNGNQITSLFCLDCKRDGIERIFRSQTALDEHIQAKHNDKNSTSIKPDWYKENGSSDQTVCGRQRQDVIQVCDICGQEFYSEEEILEHQSAFIPVTRETEVDLRQYACSYCNKQFRERRARLQHENTCKHRLNRNSSTIQSL